jgi:hypothetical protein
MVFDHQAPISAGEGEMQTDQQRIVKPTSSNEWASITSFKIFNFRAQGSFAHQLHQDYFICETLLI